MDPEGFVARFGKISWLLYNQSWLLLNFKKLCLCRLAWIREMVQVARTLCVYLNAHKDFNECNSCKLHPNDSASCVAWYFQENSVTLATSISHGTCCCMHNVSKSKAFPSGRNNTSKQESKYHLLHNELCYLSLW